MSLPKKKFKALIADCDGTLVASQRDALPSAKVTDAVRKAAKILHVGIATQRTLDTAAPIIKHLNLSGPSIVAGGAQVVDSQTLKVIKEEAIEAEDLQKAINIITKYKGQYELFLIHEKGEDLEWDPSYKPIDPLSAYLGGTTEELVDQLKKELSNSAIEVMKVVPWEGQFEEKRQFGAIICNAMATKQHGIFEVAKILGIDTHEIIGIGDSYNDFPLLMACGLKVAMGNAIEDLKAIADYIAPPVEEDGVADVINKFVL